MTLPGDHDIILYQGDTDVMRFTFLEDDAARSPVDLTGSTVVLTAKFSRRDTDPVFEWAARFTNPLAGEFEFDIASAATKTLGLTDSEIRLQYDIQYSHGANVITIVRGVLTILPEVTQ